VSLNFPKNPVDGAEFSLGGRTWRYNSTYGVWDKVPDPADGGVESFNGVTGAVVTDALVLPCAGISGPSAITFGNGELIRNNPDGSIQILPNDAGGNHYGIEIDSTEWGYGPVITGIEEDGTQVNNAIKFDSDVVLGLDASSTPSRLMFDSSASRGMQLNSQGDGTVMFGANAGYGTYAVADAADMHRATRSMSASDKHALGITNPQFFVYSKDADNANDYIRIEHDQTDANIFSGAGNINLVPADGSAVGISGGISAGNLHVDGISLGAGGITFPDGTGVTSANRTDGYSGQIETAADKTYTIDPKVPTARTITGFFIQSGSGTVTATLKNASLTVKAASVSTSSGAQTSLGNTSVPAGTTLTMVTSSNSSATDVVFNIEYIS
tara:strand:+ start:259 stop:1410 length:1152 start_codon:yes stop_codon:yes gene_type:complete